MIGKIFQNRSGKFIQFPLRLSDEFNWAPGERIEILEEIKESSGKEEGYLVLNLNYVGPHKVYETAWISKVLLKETFTEIEGGQK